MKWARGKHEEEVGTTYHRRKRASDPPLAALEKLMFGLADDRERRAVESWFATAPEWVRDTDLSADTAAMVYLTDLRPQYWESVEMFTQRDGSVVVYVESRRGGKTRKFTLADREGANELVAFMEGIETQGGPPDVEWFDSRRKV